MSSSRTWLSGVPLLAGLLLSSAAAPDEATISLDFSKEKLPEGWTVSSKGWKELVQLRIRNGREYFRKACAALGRRREECVKTFKPSERLEAKNLLILTALSEAAGSDVMPQFEEWGFNPRTRERQRGY